MSISERLAAFSGGQVLLHEDLKKHTTFRIGGPADWFVVPKNADALASAARICVEENMPYFLLGKGSNVLFGDKGFRGVVISTKMLCGYTLLAGNRIHAEVGAELKDVCAFAQTNGLSGLEFACGIPGSVGGAVFMNAGAYDGEIQNVVATVTVLRPDGSRCEISQDDMAFGYRQSLVQSEKSIALDVIFQLEASTQEGIAAKMADLQEKRESKQPLEMASAGSTFKRPEGHFAGKLIMDAGLRGHSIGGAQVSEKHCGFVINKGNATAADVLALIAHVQETVQRHSGVWLEPEVRLIGE